MRRSPITSSGVTSRMKAGSSEAAANERAAGGSRAGYPPVAAMKIPKKRIVASPIPANANILRLEAPRRFVRNGVSTYLQETTANRAPAATRASRAAGESGSSDRYLANARNGQCQRYSEYETSPTNTGN